MTAYALAVMHLCSHYQGVFCFTNVRVSTLTCIWCIMQFLSSIPFFCDKNQRSWFLETRLFFSAVVYVLFLCRSVSKVQAPSSKHTFWRPLRDRKVMSQTIFENDDKKSHTMYCFNQLFLIAILFNILFTNLQFLFFCRI